MVEERSLPGQTAVCLRQVLHLIPAGQRALVEDAIAHLEAQRSAVSETVATKDAVEFEGILVDWEKHDRLIDSSWAAAVVRTAIKSGALRSAALPSTAAKLKAITWSQDTEHDKTVTLHCSRAEWEGLRAELLSLPSAIEPRKEQP